MDDQSFDRLAKTLGIGGTRRAATGLLAGGALGALLGHVGLAPAQAADRHGHCRRVRSSCERGEQCCSNRCKEGFCTCKTRGKCQNGKACCSGKCHDGRCDAVHGTDFWDCKTKSYYCFKDLTQLALGVPVELKSIELPACWTKNPLNPCEAGIQPKCPKTACQACNERFPACQNKCVAAATIGGRPTTGRGGWVNYAVCRS